MFYFTKRNFLILGVEKFVDAAATAGLLIATADAFDVVSVSGWAGLGKAAILGGLVAVLRHLSTNGPDETR